MTRPRTQRRPATAPSLIDAIERVQRAAGATNLAPNPIPSPADLGELRDARGYGRNLANAPGDLSMHKGREPRNKGKRYKPNPPSVEECMAMLRACPDTLHGRRLYAAIVLMWQGALRAFEALALVDDDLDQATGSINIQHGKGDKAATIKMAAWAWPLLDDWRTARRALPNPTGSLLCVIEGPTAGRAWAQADMRHKLKVVARQVGITKRMSCHQLRHGFAVQAYTANVPLRGITDTYLQGLGVGESHDQVYQQAIPTVPATVLLELARG